MNDLAVRRMSKRMAAARRNRGACCLCKFRERTGELDHCKGNPNRAYGMCARDSRLPKFRTDEQVLEGFRDAN